jgi:NADH-quinone oxidoreductase subunit J
MTQLLFLVFGGTALGSALMCVTRRNAVASAVWLVVAFFGLAGCYVVLEATFVAAVQVLVYAGAIMVLFLFVIMLLDLRSEGVLAGSVRMRLPAVALALLFLTVGALCMVDATRRGLFPDAAAREALVLDGGARAIGEALFTRWVLAFEVTSILLLGAILGAVVLTKRRLP